MWDAGRHHRDTPAHFGQRPPKDLKDFYSRNNDSDSGIRLIQFSAVLFFVRLSAAI